MSTYHKYINKIFRKYPLVQRTNEPTKTISSYGIYTQKDKQEKKASSTQQTVQEKEEMFSKKILQRENEEKEEPQEKE